MARLVVSPRKRRSSISTESSSTSGSSRIVVKKASESTSRVVSTRVANPGTLGNVSSVDTQLDRINRPRRSTRLSTVHGDVRLPESTDVDKPAGRNISGETLVPAKSTVEQSQRKLLAEGIDVLNMDWKPKELDDLLVGTSIESKLQRRKSTRLSMLTNAVVSSASVLGKRGREALESGKDKILAIAETKKPSLRSNNLQESVVEGEERPRKKSRLTSSATPKTLTITETIVVSKPQIRAKKKWLAAGLYVGQERDFDPRLNESRNRLKRLSKKQESVTPQNKFMPLPMFAGERLLEHGRSFKLPYDVFSPLPPGQPKPYDWKKTGSNRFIGDAASEWREHKHLPVSRCLCIPESRCGEQCLNRHMLYECDNNNCNIGDEFCTNRAFADLKERCKSGKKYDIGVEVMKTATKGFGVRACRAFNPNQIIVEYAGEIITQEECDRRMQEEYKNNECYYLMTFDQNMIIDATRGSIARFINHSCEPNCKMVKWTVAGKPRMALFAGDSGIMTGDELTYDYNFDPFSQKNVQACHCGMPSCRGVLGPKSSKEKDKEEKKIQQTNSVLAGTKRKFQQLINESNASSKRAPSTHDKKCRTIVNGITNYNVQTKGQKRIASSASTLVEKENVIPIIRARAGSSGTSSTDSKTRVTKRPSPPRNSRRNTLGSLTRLASAVKRNASVIKMTSSLRRPTRKSLSTKTIGNSLEPSNLDFTDETPEKPSTVKRYSAKMDSLASKQKRGSLMRSPSIKSAAGTIKRNIVRSIKGDRRADAIQKMGLSGKTKVSKSMRVVEGDE